MEYDSSTNAAYAVLFSVLSVFTLIAIASADYFRPCLPERVNSFLVLRPISKDELEYSEGNENLNRTTDFFLSARSSASSFSIALSFFASGMGAWVIYGPTELGATPSLSWLGVIGYAFASSAPAIITFVVGPHIKEMCPESSFSFTDFGRQRYGRVMQIVIALLAVFYMFIYIVAEMTAISNIYGLLCGMDTTDRSTMEYTTSIAISIGVFTVFYTSVAGLPASIVTDKFQGFIMMFLVLLLVFAVTLHPQNKITREEFALASNWTVDGFMAAITLFIAVASAEMFNLGTWQRVWAAESVSAMRRGFAGGSALVFLLMMFFGVMGMIAYAKDPYAYDNGLKFSFLAFFDLLEPLGTGWHVITLILVTALAASSIDTLQNALTCTFSTDLIEFGWNPKWITRCLVVAINVPAIIMSAMRYDVISLFLVADLVCATSVLPVFLGLMVEDKANGWITAPTELGALLGCMSGVFTVVVIGVVVQAPGGLFNYFWLPNGAICALCGSKTMITFIITPLSGGFFALVLSKLDVKMRGDAARSSLFSICNKAKDSGNDCERIGMEEGSSRENSFNDTKKQSTSGEEAEIG